MRRAVQVGAEGDPFFGDLTKLVQAEDLKTARIGENRARPGHETVQSAKFADLIDTWAKEKMVGIAQENLDAQVFEKILRNSFYCRQGAHGHEDRSFDLAMRRDQPPRAGIL